MKGSRILRQMTAVFVAAVMLLLTPGSYIYADETGTTEKESSEKVKSETDQTKEADPSSEDLAEWTVMLYLCGTDYETDFGAASLTLSEIASTVPNDSVNVVIQTGGTKKWQAKELGLRIDPKKIQRYSYGEDGFLLVDEQPLYNMADSNTLSDFITWGTTNYPAKKNMLVLWDHGGGTESGLINDEHYDSMMSLPDFEKAIEKADTKFEVVTFDCCLMAGLEIDSILKDHSRYCIASEEVEPAASSAWDKWLQFLYDVPDCDGAEFGTLFCDSYMQKYIEYGDEMSSTILTCSVVDLSRIEAVEKAADDFFLEIGRVLKDPARYRLYTLSTRFVEKYGTDLMIDLVDLADKAREAGIANKEAIALRKAVNDAVVHSVKGTGRSYSHGISIFNGINAGRRELNSYARGAKSAPYLAYLDSLHTDWTAPDWVYEETEDQGDISYADYGIDPKLSLSEQGDLVLNIENGKNVVCAVDYILYKKDENVNGRYEELGWCENVNIIDDENAVYSADFKGTWPAIDGKFLNMQLRTETPAYTSYCTPVAIDEIDKEKYSGVYPPEAIEGDILRLASSVSNYGQAPGYEIHGFLQADDLQENNSLPGRGTYSLNTFEGSTLSLLYPVEDEFTENTTFVRGESFELTRKLSIEETALPAGEYGCSFVVFDGLGRQHMTEMVPLIWDGEKAEYNLDLEQEELPVIEKKEADVIRGGNAVDTITVYYFEDQPHIPYIGIKEYYDCIMEASLDGKKPVMTIEETDEEIYTLSNPYGKATIDTILDTLESEDITGFTNLMSLNFVGMENGYYDGWPYARVREISTEDPGNATFDFSDYDIEIYGDGRDVYFPESTLSDMFSDLPYHFSIFTGEDLILNQTPEECDEYMETGGIIYPVSKMPEMYRTRSEDLIEYDYNELCFNIDNFYGFSGRSLLNDAIKEKGLDLALKEYGKAGEKTIALLKSPDFVEYLSGCYILNAFIADGGHTLLLNMPPFDMLTSEEGDKFRSIVRGIYEEFPEIAGRNSENSDYYVELRAVEANLDPYGGANYIVEGDTLICNFPSFMEDDLEAWKAFYSGSGELPEPADSKGEGFLKVIDAYKRASEDPKIKNFVLDISRNPGGSLDLVAAVKGLLTGERIITVPFQNVFTGQSFTQSYEVDNNLDGVFDDRDNLPKEDLNIAIMTSKYSFSCGNVMPSLMKEDGYMIIGEKSGGGSCAIQISTTAEGMTYNISSGRFKMISNKSIDNLDEGIPVDVDLLVKNEDGTNKRIVVPLALNPDEPDNKEEVEINDYSGFYDIGRLSEEIKAFYAK